MLLSSQFLKYLLGCAALHASSHFHIHVSGFNFRVPANAFHTVSGATSLTHDGRRPFVVCWFAGGMKDPAWNLVRTASRMACFREDVSGPRRACAASRGCCAQLGIWEAVVRALGRSQAACATGQTSRWTGHVVHFFFFKSASVLLRSLMKFCALAPAACARGFVVAPCINVRDKKRETREQRGEGVWRGARKVAEKNAKVARTRSGGTGQCFINSDVQTVIWTMRKSSQTRC